MTFHEQLRAVRMTRATQLLTDSALTIKEIAAAVGYPSSAGFDREFRRVFATAPLEYRRLHAHLKLV